QIDRTRRAIKTLHPLVFRAVARMGQPTFKPPRLVRGQATAVGAQREPTGCLGGTGHHDQRVGWNFAPGRGQDAIRDTSPSTTDETGKHSPPTDDFFREPSRKKSSVGGECLPVSSVRRFFSRTISSRRARLRVTPDLAPRSPPRWPWPDAWPPRSWTTPCVRRFPRRKGPPGREARKSPGCARATFPPPRSTARGARRRSPRD